MPCLLQVFDNKDGVIYAVHAAFHDKQVLKGLLCALMLCEYGGEASGSVFVGLFGEGAC